MNLKLSIIFFLSMSFLQKLFAQDVIYTTSGNKINAKIVEISTNEIKYKSFSNIDGPNYVIYSSDVVLINFENGTTQIINANAPSLKPVKEETPVVTQKTKEKLPDNIYYLNPNLISINALGLANGDITILYDRDLCNNHLGLTALGSYNINKSINTGFNSFINEAGGNVKKNFDAGLGVNFMPSNTSRGQYFVGFLGKYMNYNYEEYEYVLGLGSILKQRVGSQIAVMLTNGCTVRVTQNFNFKLFASVGLSSNRPFISLGSNGIKQEVLPKFYFGYCFGYRF